MPEPMELTISDDESTYTVVASYQPGGWMPMLLDFTSGTGVSIWPVGAQAVMDAAPYRTPWGCLEALIRFVGTEMMGIKA